MVQLGIDIGGTCVKAAIWNNGSLAKTGQSPFYTRPTTEQLHAAIIAATGPLPEVHQVGLCVPGLLDVQRRVITLAVNVPGLVEQALNRLVPRALGLANERPTFISNDAAAAGYDIYRSRMLTGRLLVITLGTGVGNAVVDDGGVVLDMGGGASGHIGQIDVTLPDGDVPVGPDGGSGGLEAYMGVASLRRTYGNDVSAAVSRFRGTEAPLRALARALRICHAIYRPQHICLCGGVGIRLTHVLPQLRGLIDDRLTNVARPGWTLTCGDDDFHAARGAALMALAG